MQEGHPSEIRDLTDVDEALARAERSHGDAIIEPMVNAVKWLADRVRHQHWEAQYIPISLSHYTTFDVMVALMKDGPAAYLRLYDALHVNDPEEGKAHPWGQKIDNELRRTAKQGRLRRFSSAYVLSFVGPAHGTEALSSLDVGDDLASWRTYGRDGRGCSITFRNVRQWTPRHQIRKILYSDDDRLTKQGDFVLRLIRLLTDPRNRPTIEKIDLDLDDLDECFAQRFLCKGSAYAQENEYRIVVFADKGDVQFGPPRDGQLRHYLELPDWQLRALVYSNTRVLVGPAVDYADDVVQSLKTLWLRADPQRRHPIRFGSSPIRYRPS